MSFRSRVLSLVEVVLRVPPLFVIDEILKIGLGLTDLSEHDLSSSLINENEEKPQIEILYNYTSVPDDPAIYRFIIVALVRLLFSAIGCAGGICLFILSTKHLMVVYMYLMSIIVAYMSYYMNLSVAVTVIRYAENISEPVGYIELATTHGMQVFQTNVVQGILAFVFMYVHLGSRNHVIEKMLLMSFVFPSPLCLLPLPAQIKGAIPLIFALVPGYLINVVLFTSVISVVQSIYNGYLQVRNYVSNFGISALVESEWVRLNVPEVLRTFWILRVLEHAGIFFISGYWTIEDGNSPSFRLLKYLMVTGCDTLTAVLGITSIVSYICNLIGKFFQWILLMEDENDKNFGTVSAIVFYILALQTGLTGLEPDVRFVRLCRNFCLLFTALLHFTHNVVNPLLMSLSASHNPSLRRHVHALLVCSILVVLPLILMYFLWSTQEPSTWLLAVTAFSIEVIVKVFVTLSIYGLFLLDAVRETFWEKLDDYIYYIRAFGNTVEFCFGIFLFFNGAWILLFESGSAIRAIMMCIHAYFNIWCDAKAGWSVFMKRRTAVNKIESLPEADREQLRQLEDVCAICYQEMQSAKITKCKHFFHGVCLRKWLYVQDRCPLCHEILHSVDATDKRDNSNIEQLNPVVVEQNDER